MNGSDFFNPFLELIDQPIRVVNRILKNRKQESQAKESYKRVVEAYRSIVKNPAYSAVYKTAAEAMGMNLTLLVQRSLKCSHCAEYAARVSTLSDIVMDPMDQVWKESIRMRAQEDSIEEG